MPKSAELKLVMLIALVVGVCSVGILGLAGYTHTEEMHIMSSFQARLFVNVLFWGAFIMAASALNTFWKLYRSKKFGNEYKVISSLGLVVALTHLGQFAVAGLKFFKHHLLPDWLSALILTVIWWSALALCIVAFRIYREL